MSNGTAPPPVLNTLAPIQSAANQSVSVVLAGSAFDSGVVAFVTLADGTTTRQYSPISAPSATEFEVTIPPSDIPAAGTLQIAAQNSDGQLSGALPYTVIAPATLVWANITGWIAQPQSGWIYVVSRPMVSPGNMTPFRAYRYDGTVPYGYQFETDIGLYSNALDAQNACQTDWDQISQPAVPGTATGGGGISPSVRNRIRRR